MQKLARTHREGETTRAATIDEGAKPPRPFKRFQRAPAIGRTAAATRLNVIAGIAAAFASVSLSSHADDVQMPPIEPAAEAGVSSTAAFNPGDIAASGFSGTKLIVESLPLGIDPVSKSFLNPDGIVLW